ncbi:MAG: type IV toxin-antitoxin system AbiEi family antitoxin domain-containing protein [Acidobacteria bacterium]|nr:type IV toxin-antitoxin system AbiEi family antitoxin domain-containing protein [Acidobacteriota bacterium]MDA1236657.1 type IV toxin-antitoxin system AbiEi family antitoxin domain-containing protein [Acidobacteriota bacterium]
MSKLNDLFQEAKSGRPVTSDELNALGISADLAVHYVRAGWLKRLARGVYVRPDSPVELYPSLQQLERRLEGLHVGGKTALDWHGVRHNLAQRPQLQLYGWASGRLPAWFTERFPASYHRLRLFDEPSDTPLRVARFQRQSDGPLVSEPERAVLELLSDVGVRQPLQEARDVLEGATSLRAAVLQELLLRCRQVKTVRLCLTLGRELGLPWATKLDPEHLPTGSDKRWVGRSKEGLLVLEP